MSRSPRSYQREIARLKALIRALQRQILQAQLALEDDSDD